jgi:hypothetical protein
VSRLFQSLALVAATTLSHAGTTLATETPVSDVAVATDLAAVIALQGLPCGKVVSASQLGPDDYVASCQDGSRYRVFVNADGRVIVEKVDQALRAR